jgi:RimJ/RimL family protein N-acetyltransferase
MSKISSSQLVALPFNALATHVQATDCGSLWSLALNLFSAEVREVAENDHLAPAIREILVDRYARRSWSLAKIQEKPETFLQEETCRTIPPQLIGAQAFGFLAHEQMTNQIVGEFGLITCPGRPAMVYGFDYLAPAFRGRKLGHELLALRLKTAAARGYETYTASVDDDNSASRKRLSGLVAAGLAQRGPQLYRHLYTINLAPYR